MIVICPLRMSENIHFFLLHKLHVASKQLTVSGNLTLDGVYSKGTVSRAHVSMDGSGKTVSSGTSSFSILVISSSLFFGGI